jgi:hypothetical protein
MKLLRYVVGVLGLLIVWFVVAVVVDFIFLLFYPETLRFGIGYLPGIILGLLAGIQSFRASVRQSKMKNDRIFAFTPKKVDIIVLIGLLCIAASIYNGCKPVWQYDHLEQNARKVITGAEIQTWATNLLDSYPPTNTQINLERSKLGTNFPPQLLGLAPRLGPHLAIYLYNDSPRSLRLWWGSGFLGGSGFEIGSTNFVYKGHEWQPGVYFFTPYN